MVMATERKERVGIHEIEFSKLDELGDLEDVKTIIKHLVFSEDLRPLSDTLSLDFGYDFKYRGIISFLAVDSPLPMDEFQKTWIYDNTTELLTGVEELYSYIPELVKLTE